MDYYELVNKDGAILEEYADFSVIKIKIGNKIKSLLFSKTKQFYKIYFCDLNIVYLKEKRYLFIDSAINMAFIMSIKNDILSQEYYYRGNNEKVYSKTDELVEEGIIILHLENGYMLFNIDKGFIASPIFDYIKGEKNIICFWKAMESDEYKGESTTISIFGTASIIDNKIDNLTTVSSPELEKRYTVSKYDDLALVNTKSVIQEDLNKYNKKRYKQKQKQALIEYEYEAFTRARKKKDQR